MSDLAREVEELTEQVRDNNDQINQLEYDNNKKIEEIGGLKSTILTLKSEYMERISDFNQIKMDREDCLIKINQLEHEIGMLLAKFDYLSDLLGEDLPEEED